MTIAKLATSMLFVALAAACGTDKVAPAAPGGQGPDAAGAATPGTLSVRVRGTTSPVPHDAGGSGTTPRDESLGILSLVLSQGDSDPDPLVVFDNDAFIETPLIAGSDTQVATLPASALRPGLYTRARLVVTHLRYRVDATFHGRAGRPAPTKGAFLRLLVLSGGFVVDEKKRVLGENLATFIAADGEVFGTHQNVAPVSDVNSNPYPLELKGGRNGYVIKIKLEVPATIPGDAVLVLEANTHECFRWADLTAAEYTVGTWDIREESFEPATQVSPNGWDLRLEAGR